jgi:tetratricopeptide (TPR) repeat protein
MTNPEARLLNRRGMSRFQSGDVAGAFEDFRAAAALQDDFAEPWNNTGLIHQLQGRCQEAISAFERALVIRPNYPDALTNRGRTRQALGDDARALADYDQALKLASGTPFAAVVLHNRGMLRQQGGDLAAALADFDEALRLDPRLTSTYVARGLARNESGALGEALADFDRALEQNPSQGVADIYHGRGGVRVLQNDFAGALADYDQALRLQPDNYLFYISRGNARYHLRDRHQVQDYRMAFRLDAEGACREFARFLKADAQRDAAGVLDNCAKHLRVNERDATAYARRGLTQLALGREAEAAADLAHYRELAPEMRAFLDRIIELMGFPQTMAHPRHLLDQLYAKDALWMEPVLVRHV